MSDQATSSAHRFPPFADLPAGALRLVQITDPHLYADPENRLVGLKTQESLDLVIEQVKARILPVDLVLITGDVVHDSTPTGYQRFRRHIEPLGAPAHCIPGNHDKSEVLDKWLNSGRFSTAPCVRLEDWALVMLDSSIPNSAFSHLPDEELQHLERCLEANRDRHVMICLHHQPVPVGSTWMDTMAVDNPEEFFAIVDRYPNVRAILFGHIHQEFEGERNGVRLMGTPSTCIQFTPKKVDFGLDEVPPGYRWIALLPNGAVRSGVERLPEMPTGLDLNSWGYV